MATNANNKSCNSEIILNKGSRAFKYDLTAGLIRPQIFNLFNYTSEKVSSNVTSIDMNDSFVLIGSTDGSASLFEKKKS